MLEVWIPLFGGFVLLLAGGELLVRGAVQAATFWGVSPLVIGLTLVGFGTSTPELVTSVQAALVGAPGIAFGNIVGSNIANILLIGGIAALLFPISVSSTALKRDSIVMLGVGVVFALLAAALDANRIVGVLFLATLAVYVYEAFRHERVTSKAAHGAVFDKTLALSQADPTLSPGKEKGSIYTALLISLSGLLLVVLGGKLLVDGAVTLARSLEISETVIGLSIVAVGTSLPELVTSIVAGLKRQVDVAFGNIIGSNIYNILGIGGATALIAPSAVPAEIVRFDNLVMICVSVVFVFFAYTRFSIARWEGAVLLAGYCVYVYYLWP
ncbi:MAG: calcium/sodium antiporter [Roseibium album]|uniref:calcium/sodium antiporter n=1 Tax=Roseibium album TaxID=311410 RepID=UPI0032F0844A